jgi:UDP-N-acetylmuramyl pentapeptide phosphotransferase/UDP-N-acetylglucosamine-1-phosphate transferase
MLLLIAIASGIISGIAATALTVRVLGRRAVLDVPNQRSSHSRPTVRGGGIGLATGTLVVLAIGHTDLVGSAGIALVIAGLGFGAIGLVDDLTSALAVTIRLMLQLVAAAAVVAVLWEHTSQGTLLAALVGALAALWIISFVNAFNFMDGINGISCAETIVAGVAFGLLARHEHQLALQAAAFALVAGSIGFAPFNFPTARIFLGDVGSYFAGAWLAVLVVIGLRGSIPAEAMVAPVVLYVADTGVTLVRRVHRHEAWHQAHRQHTYQRLVDLGWSHTQTTGLVFALVTLCSVLGSVSLLGSVPGRVAADLAVVVLVAGYLVLPQLIARRRPALPRDGRTSRVFRSGADR